MMRYLVTVVSAKRCSRTTISGHNICRIVFSFIIFIYGASNNNLFVIVVVVIVLKIIHVSAINNEYWIVCKKEQTLKRSSLSSMRTSTTSLDRESFRPLTPQNDVANRKMDRSEHR